MKEEKKGKKVLDEYRTKKLNAKHHKEIESPQKIISTALAKDYPQMGENVRNQLAHIMVKEDVNRKLKIGDEEISVGSLEARIAESIEAINCGTSSKEEYHDWINVGQEIISDMNCDGVTPQELDIKNAFIADLGQREIELMTCLGLYKSAIVKNPKLQAKYDELYLKLQKLREIRSAVKNSTKNIADKVEEKAKEEENAKVNPSLADKAVMTVTIGALGAYDRLSKEQKKQMSMYHGEDFNGMDFQKHLLNHFMYNNDIPNKSLGEDKYYEASPLEANLLAKRSTQKDITNHIEMLRERINKGKEKGFKDWKVDTKEFEENKPMYQNRGVFQKALFEKAMGR